ncbi:unnamed protein product [Peronospora destructor]|uniref:Uncharacterized protein n=1 Tax=Peronospora destructor TaxID=86335 RepID=A0AAV0TIQ9_9STRA|nr:unnamed protein product [Peronospora destructor]
MKVKPQLDEAIAYLQAKIAALCAKEKDENILELAVAVAAGKSPLPEAQFGPLLAVWTPKTSPIALELAALVDQFEASKRREEEEEEEEKKHWKEEDRDVKVVVYSAIEQVKEERGRLKTRPRRRFEGLDECDASPSASNDTLTSPPRTDGIATDVKETMKEKEKMDEVKAVKMKEKEKHEEKKDEEMEENTEIKENKMETKEKKMVQVGVEKEENVEKDELKKNVAKKNEAEKNEVKKNEVEKNEVEKNEAETAVASLKALRKSMLLDVLSKIVSVAKSKDVDPAMFTLTNGENQAGKDENQVDLTKIKDRVAEGVVCEWAHFAEQVYLFCQHVVTDAEQREQPETRRKGVELLHFARTLTETLRKASIPKEATLLQKIQEAEMEAAARKEEKEAACNEKAMKNDTLEESTADANDDQAMKATAFDSHASSSKTANDEFLDPGSFSPPRASTRIGERTSIASDGTGSAASSRNSRKRMRVVSVSAASASEEVSGSESCDASASEADTKSREQGKTTKSSAKRTPARRVRPSLPATRISSRQQTRRAAAAAAAAAADSTGSGNEEEYSESEALSSIAEKEGDDANENNEKARNVEQEEEQPTPKKKKAATKRRSRKKGWCKR